MHVSLYSIHPHPTGTISMMARPRGGDWLCDEIKALRASGVDVLVSLLTAREVRELELGEEEACCREQGIMYLSFGIVDLSVPPLTEETVLFLQQLKGYLLEGRHVAFHCRQGVGRSGLMAASLLVLTGLAPEVAFEQLSRVRGYAVPETGEQRAWVMAFFQRQG